ncbi:DoxX family protein [Pseudoalteromonas carrageenovora]|uniref:HvfX family Cu-binding RiPP maturation protein n=1 Tax=Pseudoalteromonas carrageenovora TaxID=227 RepID=UPI0026E2B365|nr:DoxX family protein [Pseudoalteromonas carrageenovora]MDO6834681.1 DoxX family protein [Pseudoalteromonas carrageenovora]
MKKLTHLYESAIGKLSFLDGLPALLFRLILAPVMIIAGYNKLAISGDSQGFFNNLLASPDVVQWFGNSEWGLGLPFPDVLAFLAGWSEFLGGWFLLFGLLTRLVSIPLMFTMVVAATSVHWHNGWFAIAPTNPDTSAAQVLDWLSIPGAKESLENSLEVQERIGKIRGLVDEHGFPDYLYERGKPSILNNGIEFSAIYFAMLLSLFFVGGGRFVSVDYWLKRTVVKR